MRLNFHTSFHIQFLVSIAYCSFHMIKWLKLKVINCMPSKYYNNLFLHEISRICMTGLESCPGNAVSQYYHHLMFYICFSLASLRRQLLMLEPLLILLR